MANDLQRRPPPNSPLWLRDAFDLLHSSGRARQSEAATARNALKLLEDLAPAVRDTVRKLMALRDGTKYMDEFVATSIEQALDTPSIARARFYRRISGQDESFR